MIELCLGTYLTITKMFKGKSITQKELVAKILSLFDENFDESDDSMISNLVTGRKNPSSFVLEPAKNLLADQCDILVNQFDRTVIPLLDPNKKNDLVKSIKFLVVNDDDIDENTKINLITGTTKSEIVETTEGLSEFLAGILLYVLVYTENKNSAVKKINSDFLEMASKALGSKEVGLIEREKSSEDNVTTSVKTVIDSRIAREFCIRFEKDLPLLPLCQIAHNLNPLHQHRREMYTEYNLLTDEERNDVLSLAEIPKMEFEKDDDWTSFCLNRFETEAIEKNYATRPFLYDNAKYFRRGFTRYSDMEIPNKNPYIYQKYSEFFKKEIPGTLLDYIELYFAEPQNYPTPMDFLWEVRTLGDCPEDEMTFWITRYIISVCYDWEDVSSTSWKNCFIEENLLKNMEDFYYFALFELYLVYLTK